MIDCNNMDIAFFRYSLFNRGGDRMIVEHANHLANIGCKVTLYVSIVDSVFTLHKNVKVVLIGRIRKLAFLFFATTYRFPHDAVIVDIIHLPLLVGIRNKVVYFAQADDVEYYKNPLARKFIDCLYRMYLGAKAQVITVDSRLNEIFGDRYGFRRCNTVQNGIDLTKFFPDPDQQLITAKGQRKAIFFMARGDFFRKGFDFILELLKRFDNTIDSSIEFWVCGDKLISSKYSFPVREFGILSDERLRQLLSSADIFLYPSRHEGFGLFPLEAMACGCVAVTSDAIPYARQTPSMMVSTIGDIHLMFEHVRLLITDESFYAAKSTQALHDVKKYDMATSKREFAQTLASFLAGAEHANWH